MYISIGSRRGLLRYSDGTRDPSGSTGSRATKSTKEYEGFYIRLGRYLLDRSFVLNSNNILIY
jgi:hypothetical protein